MAMPLPWPSEREAIDLPVDELGMRVLWRLADSRGPSLLNGRNFILETPPTGGMASETSSMTGGVVVSTGPASLRSEYARALTEAWEWLLARGLLAPDRDQQGDWVFITRRGREVAADRRRVERLRAERRLDVELHPRLEERVRRQYLIGEFEPAALMAMREVEIRVRDLSSASQSDIGVKLMKMAFRRDHGPLADSVLDPGEQEATMALFWGAIGVFKNPSSHRQIEFDDPIEAAEIILFADLLMRLLDRVEARLNHA
jgi:uncharacterized protein (TIGR02391 family)